MIKSIRVLFAICGIAFGLAAFPVFGQQQEPTEINKKPLQDFAKTYQHKDIDWSKPFRLELDGVITNHGKWDNSRTKFTNSEGDAELIEAAKSFIGAIGDTGWLVYFSQRGISEIKMLAEQTSSTLTVQIVMPMTSEEQAKSTSRGFNSLSTAVLLDDSNGTKKLGDDERRLLKATKSESTEIDVMIRFAIPAKEFQEMVRKHLAPMGEAKTPTSGK